MTDVRWSRDVSVLEVEFSHDWRQLASNGLAGFPPTLENFPYGFWYSRGTCARTRLKCHKSMTLSLTNHNKHNINNVYGGISLYKKNFIGSDGRYYLKISNFELWRFIPRIQHTKYWKYFKY